MVQVTPSQICSPPAHTPPRHHARHRQVQFRAGCATATGATDRRGGSLKSPLAERTKKAVSCFFDGILMKFGDEYFAIGIKRVKCIEDVRPI